MGKKKVKPNATDIFSFMTANETLSKAKEQKDPTMLWKEYWYEGEVCCLFADTNVGKSILAVQIGNEIAKSSPKDENVLYYDFELSKKQFEKRYSDEKTNVPFEFNNNFIRVELNSDAIKDLSSLEDVIMEAIEASIVKFNSKVIIVDNISWLVNMKNSSVTAGKLMQKLCMLKKKYNLSVLVLAHTKKRNLGQPINENDLSGTKKFSNFFDAMFAIGRGIKDPSIRYTKQIKVRSGEFKYDTNNVEYFNIEKDSSFLKFVHKGFLKEKSALNKEPNKGTHSDKVDSAPTRIKSKSAQNQIDFIEALVTQNMEIAFSNLKIC